MCDIALKYMNRFDRNKIQEFNASNSGTPIFLIDISQGEERIYITTSEHFFDGYYNDFDLPFMFKEMDKSNEIIVVVNQDSDTEPIIVRFE